MEEKKRPDFEFFSLPVKKEAPPGASLSHRRVPYAVRHTVQPGVGGNEAEADRRF